jgi:ribonuclease G
MSKELVIGSNRHETKVGVLEDDQLVEVYFQRANEYSLAGSIHKGRVTRVLPGMQSAFVDLGLERDTFLYVSDFFEEHPDIDTVSDEKPVRGGRAEQRSDRRERPQEIRPPAVAEAATVQPARGETAPDAAQVSEPGENAGGDGQRDRRGRRSRRRRTRGRGFPENKYAAPPAVGSESPAAEPETDEDTQEESEADVLILPGESLAKYRNASTTSEAGAQTADTEESETDGDGNEPVGFVYASGVEEFQAISDVDAEEPSLSGAAEEPSETIEDEIREYHEKPYESLEVYLAGDDEDTVEMEALESEPEPAVAEGAVPPVAAEDEIQFNPEAQGEEIPTGTGVFAAEDGEQQGEPSSHDPAADEAGVTEGEGTEPRNGQPPAANEPATENAQPQTATVREEGGRYLHRVSRRMRRRRGRFGQQEHGGESHGSAATATAPASEARIEEPAADRQERPREERFTREDRPRRDEKGESKGEDQSNREERSAKDDRTAKEDRPLPLISDLLKAGQEIIVQIAKEPLGQKGARITSHVALPGRYVVYMPSVDHLGVSRKIESEEERHRLKRILQAHRVGTTGGFIVRTAGAGRTEDEIAADMNFLYNLWLDIRQKAEKKPAPALLHHDLDVVQRILRDQLTDDYKSVWVDSEEMYESVLRFVQRFQPALVSRVKMYTRSAPIFDAFNITQELEKAMRPKVWLKSGGYIVINQTEALVAIDVNTGKFVGKSNKLEDTIVKTNTEAVKEIVRQIRLRDLGGIIVVDFIDMDERKNRQKVMQALEEAMHSDKAPYKILQFNDFGLVAITRKRVKQSLERTLCSPCSYCEGAGYVKSVQTVISEILVEAQKIARAIEGKDVVLRCHPDVAKTFKSRDNQYLEELEEILGRPVLVTGDPLIHHEKFDLT